MKKQAIVLMGLLVAGVYAFIEGMQREYLATPLIVCKEYDQVYDARGNIKDPMWYMQFEEQLLTGGWLSKKMVEEIQYSGKMTTLVGRPYGMSSEAYNIYISGVPTIQFSHQFITSRVNQEILKKMEAKGLIPKNHTGSVVQVCRVYYVMKPFEKTMQPLKPLVESQKKADMPADMPDQPIESSSTVSFQ